ncbi:MAG: cation transporter [Phycisphaerales bacterium]|nr:cation transporter [Phycisphaerales bacterium]
MNTIQTSDQHARHDASNASRAPRTPPLERDRQVRRVTWWGLAANLSLSAIKFIVGVFASSQALIADAAHSLSDSVTDMAVLVGVGFWSAPADAGHPHGHGRIETIVTTLIGLLLAGAGIGLAYRALVTLEQPHRMPPGWSVFAVACLSMVSKEALYRWTARVGLRVHSTALLANAWHHRSDAISSVPVAVAVMGIHLQPTWTFLDHIAAIVVSLLIIRAAWGIVWPALNQLVDAGTSQETCERLQELVGDTPGVLAVHGLRTRYIGSGLQVDLHVLVNPQLTIREGHAIAHAVKDHLLSEEAEVIDVLVHVEPYDPPGSRADAPT